MHSTPHRPNWKELYQLAMTESDPFKLPQRVKDARRAIFDRIDETVRKPRTAEHQQMNDALNGLRVLQEYEGCLQKHREQCKPPGRDFIQRKLD